MSTWNNIVESKFAERWAAVFSIIFSPGFFIGTIVTGTSLFLSIYYKSNVPFSNTMAIIGSIFGGVAGAFFKDEYDRLSNKNILEKKGRSALRNLHGIRAQLQNIEVWVVKFGKRTRKKEDKNTLEEINRHISTIDLNIAAGLEDWVDIVPELKERSEKEAAIEKKYKEAAQSVMIELLEKRKELATAKDEKIGQELKKQIGDLERQIREIKKDRSEASNGVVWRQGGVMGSPTLAAAQIDNGMFISSVLGKHTCMRCGKSFTPNMMSVGAASIYGNSYCDECKKETSGGTTM